MLLAIASRCEHCIIYYYSVDALCTFLVTCNSIGHNSVSCKSIRVRTGSNIKIAVVVRGDTVGVMLLYIMVT